MYLYICKSLYKNISVFPNSSPLQKKSDNKKVISVENDKMLLYLHREACVSGICGFQNIHFCLTGTDMKEAGACEGQRLARRKTLWPAELHVIQGGRRVEVRVAPLQLQTV